MVAVFEVFERGVGVNPDLRGGVGRVFDLPLRTGVAGWNPDLRATRCHLGESGDPVFRRQRWIPAFAGMTGGRVAPGCKADRDRHAGVGAICRARPGGDEADQETVQWTVSPPNARASLRGPGGRARSDLLWANLTG